MSATLAAAAPFITQLLKTGLDRAGSILLKKFMRLRGLDKTLRAGTFTNPALETAIRDFETILGSYRGEFTVPLAELLSELTKSGIATAMAEQALLQQEREATKARFIELYTIMVEPNQDKALDLYKTLKLALAASLSALFGNDAQAFAVSTFGKMLSGKLDLLQGAHGPHRWGEGLSPENTKALLVRLTRALQGTYRSIRIETNKGPKIVNITDIYTPARLTHRPPDVIDVNTLIPDENRKETAASLRALQNVSFSEFRDTFSRALVLGDPGGGKSTLCQYICFEMAKQSLLALQTDDPRISIPVQKIPLRITLRLYEKARIAEPQLSLFEYCSRDIAQAITAPIETCRELLGYMLTFGRAVLAFDGLDEILNTAQRRDFVDLVVNFVDQFPLCPVLVTSRVIGYKNAPMPEDYDEFTLAPFDRTEVEHYLDRFFAKVFGLRKEDRPSAISRFTSQTEKNAGDLRTNPLMLGLMAFLFSVKGDVPANRPEIYRECASLMFEKWDENRGIQANIPHDFDLIDLFSVLASRIYGNAELEAGVSKEWLLNELTSYFATQYIERSKAFIAAKTVLEFITGRAWVMSDVGSDVYSFTHRTFLEFFYARHLEQGCETVRGLSRVLLPHIKRQEWDVVCHLALQIKTSRNQPRTAQATQVLRDLMKGLRGTGKSDIAICLFVARALEYLLGTEQDMTDLVRAILSLTLASAGRGDEVATQCIHACCTVCAERRECIHNVIRDFLVDRFANPTNGSDGWVAHLISAEGQPVLAHWSPYDVPEPLCYLAEDSTIQAAVRSRASTSMHYAALRCEWYGEITEDEFRRYGFAMFFEDLRPPRQKHRGVCLLSAVADMVRPRFILRNMDVIEPPELTVARATNVLRAIARGFLSEAVGAAATNESHGLLALSPGLWKAFFFRTRKDIELFLGGLAIFTFFTFPMSSPKHHAIAPSLMRRSGDRPEVRAQIERSITYHRCDTHPIVGWYRQQLGKEAVAELATVA